jgi:hypothetical protein
MLAFAAACGGQPEDVTAAAAWTWRTAAPLSETPVFLSASQG